MNSRIYIHIPLLVYEYNLSNSVRAEVMYNSNEYTIDIRYSCENNEYHVTKNIFPFVCTDAGV